jgi:beta-glucanase (GH16 family)
MTAKLVRGKLLVTRLILFLIFVSWAQTSESSWVMVSNWSAGQAFDASQWIFERGFLRNSEQQYYTGGAPTNLAIAPDGLRLIGRNERIANAAYRKGAVDWRKARFEAQYTSASLVSVKSWRNAKIEVVANIRDGDGAWPAIWLRSRNVNGFGEIDLMEHLGREPETVHATVHFGTSASNLNVSTASHTIDGFQGKDIMYTAELSPETLVIAVNGQLMLAMDRQISVGKVQPLQQPFQLVLNLALGGAWAGPIDAAALPATMTIKSIKVWEWQPWIGPGADARLEECCKSLLR